MTSLLEYYVNLTLFSMGYFIRHILHGGGAKLPTPRRIFLDDPFFMKLHENVITTLNLTSLVVKNLWRHEFAYISNIFAAGRHISARNTSVTRILIKTDLLVRLTCMTHHFVAKELALPMNHVSTKFGRFLT